MARVRKPRGKALTLTELLGLDKTPKVGTLRGPQALAQSKQQKFLKQQAGQLDVPIGVQPAITNNTGQQIQTTIDQSLENLPKSIIDDRFKDENINLQKVPKFEGEATGEQTIPSGDATAGIDQSPSGIGSDVKEKEDDTFEIGEASDADIDYTDVGEPGSLDNETKQKSEQEQLFANVMDDYNKMYGEGTGPEGAKSIADYKADFAKATGIDISGEPDNRSALMALGLSLMQNRAGKGFNLSNILGEVGRAGEAALPKFEAAKKEARAGQIAAGKFALQERKADTAKELAFAKERRLALMQLGKEARGYKQQYLLQELKNKASLDEALLKARADAIKNNKLDLKKSLDQEVQGVKGIKIQFGFDQNGSEKILNPVSAAKGLADGYGNILQAEAAITQLEEISKEIAASPSPILTIGSDRVKSVLAALGVDQKSMFEDQTYEDATGKKVTIKGLSKEATARAIQDRLLAQYKRFLSQETGNGISNVDYQNLQRQIGEITLLTNPQERLLRLQELRKIFSVPKRRIESLFDQLNDRGFHANQDNYNRTQEVLFDVLKTSTPESFNKNFQLTDQGIKIVNVAGL
tara:strand:+ start:119 stop:1864 length:1746 start_codon:yes stop_codon:yes gene_type:complete